MEQILEVCSCKSINKAAQKLYISQSALSTSINSAEEELGRKILERSHNGITVTKFGEEFVEASRKILEIYDALLKKESDAGVPQLRVSCQYLLYARAIFTAICAEHAGSSTDFRYVEKTRDLVCQDLLDKVSELGLITTPTTSRNNVTRTLENAGLDYRIISTSDSCCMVGPKNPLYHNQEDFIMLRQLAPYPQLHYEKAPWIWHKGTFDDELSYFPHAGSLSISDSGSFYTFLIDTSSFFIGIYNKHAYEQIKFYNNIRVLQIADASFPYDTLCIWRKGSTMTEIAREYMRRIYFSIGTTPEAFSL